MNIQQLAVTVQPDSNHGCTLLVLTRSTLPSKPMMLPVAAPCMHISSTKASQSGPLQVEQAEHPYRALYGPKPVPCSVSAAAATYGYCSCCCGVGGWGSTERRYSAAANVVCAGSIAHQLKYLARFRPTCEQPSCTLPALQCTVSLHTAAGPCQGKARCGGDPGPKIQQRLTTVYTDF